MNQLAVNWFIEAVKNLVPDLARAASVFRPVVEDVCATGTISPGRMLREPSVLYLRSSCDNSPFLLYS